MEQPNIWKEHFDNMMSEDTSLDGFKRTLAFCIAWHATEEDRDDRFKHLSIIIQLKTSIAVLAKLEEIKDAQ